MQILLGWGIRHPLEIASPARALFQETDGTRVLFLGGEGDSPLGQAILSAWPGIRLEPTDFGDLFLWSLHDPWVIQLPDGRYRMYVAAKATDDGASYGHPGGQCWGIFKSKDLPSKDL